jgi:transcriptional regulator with XRE-family HTH domain
MSRVIFGVSEDFLGTAILSLRRQLGYSQEKLARELGCSTGAVRQWESGLRRPSLAAVERLRQLAPDDETRASFTFKSEISNLKSAPPPPTPAVRLPAPGDDVELIRYHNDAAEGLSLLYECAAAGHPGAKALLKAEAERLLRKGTEWRDLKYSKLSK